MYEIWNYLNIEHTYHDFDTSVGAQMRFIVGKTSIFDAEFLMFPGEMQR